MRNIRAFRAGLIGTLAALAACSGENGPEQGNDETTYPVTAYENGQWWTGDAFEPGTRYIAGDYFVQQPEGSADTVIDLAGGFVIPPLADAHMHGFDDAASVIEMANAYLADGVFYAATLGNATSTLTDAKACLAILPGPEVLFATGMITASDAHPILNYEAQAAGVQPWSLSAEDKARLASAGTREGDVYWIADTPDDVAALWPAYAAQGPDIVKVIVDESAIAAASPAVDGATLGTIAAQAETESLPVYAHIQTEEDALIAIANGADVLAHAPAYASPSTPYGEAMLAAARDNGVAITPTFARELAMEAFVPEQYRKDKETVATIERAHGARLAQMDAAGVTLLTGFDLNNGTALDEMIYWQRVSDLPDARILNASIRDTAKTLYPDRPVGCLSAGCEASFIVTADNPLKDFSRIEAATSRIKKGQVMDLPLTTDCPADSVMDAPAEE